MKGKPPSLTTQFFPESVSIEWTNVSKKNSFLHTVSVSRPCSKWVSKGGVQADGITTTNAPVTPANAAQNRGHQPASENEEMECKLPWPT